MCLLDSNILISEALISLDDKILTVIAANLVPVGLEILFYKRKNGSVKFPSDRLIIVLFMEWWYQTPWSKNYKIKMTKPFPWNSNNQKVLVWKYFIKVASYKTS